MEETYDVVVVGYGPVGELAALLLGRAGHRVGVFERYAEPYPLPRAVHYDDESARILQAAGLADALAPVVEPVGSYEWRNGAGDTLLRFDWTDTTGASGWPASTMFSQPQLEAVLDAAVRAQPTVAVRRGRAVTAVDPAGRVTLADGEQVTGRYVLGADGANSLVRRALGVPVTDLGFTYDWLVVDVRPDAARPWDPPAWQLCDPARPTTLVPGGPERRRFEFMRLPDERPEELDTEASVWRLLAPWGLSPENATLDRHAIYTFHALWAEQWGSGRVLLAGDAAHLMPPFAGQGLCAGFRDVANLAWKLDLVLTGRSGEHLIDTYTTERLGHLQVAISVSVELGKVVCVTDEQAAAERDAQFLAAPQGLAPSAPPSFPIGPGLRAPDDANAGMLFPQGRVEADGTPCLLEDLVPAGFRLLSSGGPPRVDPARRAFLDRLGTTVAWFGGPEAPLRDDEGTYEQWFTAAGCAAVLVRPDFAVFGTAQTLDRADALVAELERQLTQPDQPA